ncbi:hypothetical protein [Campylobacter ureolyticus]|uniref:Uncharacterized protein n=1 Tax=Campylobacter ureolyticus TaxID=827 RepID=A0A9Q4KM32_9BACT|nr:hypothetical protein [Campylobacter ureolyticus]MCZ6159184.1 hypothetical protein [Campylobacter ureolyticus]MCZ6162798.1 hypothetical protein [Campylobacter ureolyticus]MCZ6164709.1 hypothetical protein [Campylobacter ureolyticus]
MKKAFFILFLVLNLSFSKDLVDDFFEEIISSCYLKNYDGLKQMLDENKSIANSQIKGIRALDFILNLDSFKIDKLNNPKFDKILNEINFKACKIKILEILTNYDLNISYLVKDTYTPLVTILDNKFLSNKEKIKISQILLKNQTDDFKSISRINSAWQISIVEAAYLKNDLEMFKAYLEMGFIFDDTLAYIMLSPYFKYPKIIDVFSTKKADKSLLTKMENDREFLKELELSYKYSLHFVKILHSKKIYFDINKISAYLKLYEFMKFVKDKKNSDLLLVFIIGYLK